jgi:NADPH:quinone reductase-like Zn-dependent oxidoreductase
MKAVICTRYGPPEVLHLTDVEKPTPRNHEILIKIFATTVTASDCIIRGFNVPNRFQIPMRLVIGFTKPRRPILGMVLAGEVESVGADVTLFKEGDQVFACDFDRFVFGMYAVYTCIPETSMVLCKPSQVTYEEATAIPYGGLLALYFLKKSNIQSGQRVLIYGASGAIGTSAIQLARYFGAQVAGVCSTPNMELVKSLGATAVIDYTREDCVSGAAQYDIILDAVGKRKSAHLKYEKALAPDGKYISVDDGSPKLHINDLLFLKELLEGGQLRAVIDRTYPLEQMVEAHRYVDQGHKKGNVIITVAHVIS